MERSDEDTFKRQRSDWPTLHLFFDSPLAIMVVKRTYSGTLVYLVLLTGRSRLARKF